jgi:hypothetical protein
LTHPSPLAQVFASCQPVKLLPNSASPHSNPTACIFHRVCIYCSSQRIPSASSSSPQPPPPLHRSSVTYAHRPRPSPTQSCTYTSHVNKTAQTLTRKLVAHRCVLLPFCHKRSKYDSPSPAHACHHAACHASCHAACHIALRLHSRRPHRGSDWSKSAGLLRAGAALAPHPPAPSLSPPHTQRRPSEFGTRRLQRELGRSEI